MVELVPRLALNQEVRVRTVASQPTTMPVRLFRYLTFRAGLMRRRGFLRLLIERLRVRVPPPGYFRA